MNHEIPAWVKNVRNGAVVGAIFSMILLYIPITSALFEPFGEIGKFVFICIVSFVSMVIFCLFGWLIIWILKFVLLFCLIIGVIWIIFTNVTPKLPPADEITVVSFFQTFLDSITNFGETTYSERSLDNNYKNE